jgi:rare lipoprotein A
MVGLDCKESRYYLPGNIALAIVWVFVSFLHGCSGLTGNKPHPELYGYKETGMASFYARKFQDRITASGELLNNDIMTAAHKTLPFGAEVIVKNLKNGKSVKVRINDRGPFIKGRIIDLTRAAFSQIANLGNGVTKVEIRVVK